VKGRRKQAQNLAVRPKISSQSASNIQLLLISKKKHAQVKSSVHPKIKTYNYARDCLVLNFSDFLLFLSLCLFIFDLLFFIKLLICLTLNGTDSFDTAGTLFARIPQKRVDGKVIKFRQIARLYAVNAGVILVICIGAAAKAFATTVRLQLKEIKFRNPSMFSVHKIKQNTQW